MPQRHGLLQRKCGCGGSPASPGDCDDCSEEKRTLQRRAAGDNEPSVVPAIVDEVLRTPGQPLDLGTRTFMEQRLGHDFSQVRIHTDAKAGQSALAVDATAYTVGRDIVFGSGAYAPATSDGRNTLAHELTHVVQHSLGSAGGGGNGLSISDPHDDAERQADRVAATIDHRIAPLFVEPLIAPAISRKVLQRQPSGTPQPAPIESERSVTLDPHLDPDLIDLSLRVLRGEHRLTLTTGLSNPLNILGTPIPGIQPSQLSLLIGYDNRCNRAFQSALIGMRQTQPAGRLTGDFSRNPTQIEARGSFRAGSWRIDPAGTVGFTGSTVDSVFLTLSFTSGVSTAIPPDCIAPPARPPVPDSPVSDGGTPDVPTPGQTPRRPPAPGSGLPSYTLYFFYDATILRPESNPTYQQVVSLLQMVPRLHAMLTGHASLEGTEEHNMRLSQQRAEAMAAQLRSIEGIGAARIHTLSFGESAPAVPEPDNIPERTVLPSVERIRTMNRRVEVTFFDPTGVFGISTPELRLPTMGWRRRSLLQRPTLETP